MAQPTKEQSRGFDIMIWMEEDNAKARSYTLYGEILFHGLFSTYTPGDIVSLDMNPPEFLREIPPSCQVGYVNPLDNKIYKMNANPLQ